MTPTVRTLAALVQARRTGCWTRIADFDGVDAARAYALSADWLPKAAPQSAMTDILNDAQAMGQAMAARSNPVAVTLDRSGAKGFLTLINPQAAVATTWAFPVETVDAMRCLQKLGELAAHRMQGDRLRLVPQRDRTFLSKPGISAADADADIRFDMPPRLEGHAERLRLRGADKTNVASIIADPVTDDRHLFRLLIRYEPVRDAPAMTDTGPRFSRLLTGLLHSGDPRRMGWLCEWLTASMADLGQRIDALNPPGRRDVIFCLTGLPALGYCLPSQDRSDRGWVAQIVINPGLPAADWSALLSKVQRTTAAALCDYRAQLNQLVAAKSDAFLEYLQDEAEKTGPLPEQPAFPDDTRDSARPACGADLIDIAIPARDSMTGATEWRRLGQKGGILRARDGVHHPCRDYQITEYIDLARNLFRPAADLSHARVRMTRLVELLNAAPASQTGEEVRVLLPKVAALIASETGVRREFIARAAKQFTGAYCLPGDPDLAASLDDWMARAVSQPVGLNLPLSHALRPEDRELATLIGAVDQVSEWMQGHTRLRELFLTGHTAKINALIHCIDARMRVPFRRHGAQLAIVGGYAARLHAGRHGLDTARLDPLRRVVLHVQHDGRGDEKALFGRLRNVLGVLLQEKTMMEMMPDDDAAQPDKAGLGVRWRQSVAFAHGVRYRPVMIKIRSVRFTGPTPPALASIRGLPVLDIRQLSQDYLRKIAITDEIAMRGNFAAAHRAIAEMIPDANPTIMGNADAIGDL